MTYPDVNSEPEVGAKPAGPGPQRQTWIWAVTAALVLLVLGGAGAVIAVDAQSNNSGAVRAVASQYVEAVAAGDLETAERLFSGAEQEGSASAPDADAFASAERITDAELTGFRVEFDADRASGQLAFTLGGYPYTDRIELRRTEADEWRVTSGLRYQVMVDTTGGGALGIRGSDTALSAETPMTTLYAGEYTLVSHNPFFATAENAVFAVTSNADALFVSDWLVPGEGYAAEVRRQVAQAYEECAEQTEVWELQACGIAADEPSSRFAASPPVRASVDMIAPPSVSSSDELSTWMEITDRGVFEATYTGRDSEDRTLTEQLELRAMPADVEVTPSADGLDVAIYPY